MCTDIRLTLPNNSNVSVRNLDLEKSYDLGTKACFVKSGSRRCSIAPPGRQAYAWTVKHDYVGMLSFPARLDQILDKVSAALSPAGQLGRAVDHAARWVGEHLGMAATDYTSPSRFARMVTLNQVRDGIAIPDDPASLVSHAFHLINTVAPPFGVSKACNFTWWQVARDHADLKYYIRTYFGLDTMVIDLKEEFVAGEIELKPQSHPTKLRVTNSHA